MCRSPGLALNVSILYFFYSVDLLDRLSHQQIHYIYILKSRRSSLISPPFALKRWEDSA